MKEKYIVQDLAEYENTESVGVQCFVIDEMTKEQRSTMRFAVWNIGGSFILGELVAIFVEKEEACKYCNVMNRIGDILK